MNLSLRSRSLRRTDHYRGLWLKYKQTNRLARNDVVVAQGYGGVESRFRVIANGLWVFGNPVLVSGYVGSLRPNKFSFLVLLTPILVLIGTFLDFKQSPHLAFPTRHDQGH